MCSAPALRSQTPLFDGNLLRAGVHLNLVGTFQPHAREVDSTTVQRARVFVESYEGAPVQAGDLLIPMREGAIGPTHVAGDLHELTNGKNRGRMGPGGYDAVQECGLRAGRSRAAELSVGCTHYLGASAHTGNALFYTM